MNKAKVLITVTNYKNEEEVLAFVKHLQQQTINDSIVVVVVDNAKSQKCILDLCQSLKEFSNVRYVEAKENLGYLKGCFKGLDEYLQHNEMPDWVVVSNTDIVIDDKEFFYKFINKNYDESIWCVAPSVINNDLTYANPHYKERIPLKKVNRVIKIFKNFLLARFYTFLSNRKRKNAKKEKEQSQDVYAAHGCFFVLKNEFFKVEKIEFEPLMYSEESYIAEVILGANKRILYDADLELRHLEGAVTGKINFKQKGRYISESMKFIRDSFYLEKDKDGKFCEQQ